MAPAMTNSWVSEGGASNLGPAPLGPWEPDPAFTSQFATFGEGWVVIVFLGLHDRDGSPTLSFRAAAPLGGRVATFRVLAQGQFFCGLATGRAYVCAEARPVLPHCEGAHEFHVGHPGSQTAVINIRLAPSDLTGRRETLSSGVSLGHTPTWRVGLVDSPLQLMPLEPPPPGLATLTASPSKLITRPTAVAAPVRRSVTPLS